MALLPAERSQRKKKSKRNVVLRRLALKARSRSLIAKASQARSLDMTARALLLIALLVQVGPAWAVLVELLAQEPRPGGRQSGVHIRGGCRR